MKKNLVIIFLSLSLFLTSCDLGISDSAVSMVMKNEQEHLNNYNKIKRFSKDSTVVYFIDSLKKQYTKQAYEVKGMLESRLYESNSLRLVNIYIDSLK